MNLRGFFHRRRQESEMAEELRHHLEARAADLQRAGLPAAEAARQARLEFGSAERYKEECRASLGFRIFDELHADLRYALRGMRRQPAFTATAILILGLATGVNTAFFTLFNNYALKPLAIRGADRHFDLTPRNAQSEHAGGWTLAEWQTLERGAAQQVEGLYDASTYLVRAILPQQRPVTVTTVSLNYFPLLAGTAARGRLLGPGDEREPRAVLSHVGWQKIFDGDPDAIGKTIRVRQTAYTVIGVAKPEFTGTEPVVPDFWVPVTFRDAVRESPGGQPRYGLAGLLRPGVTTEQAAQALGAIAGRLPRPAAERVANVELKRRQTIIGAEDEIAPVSALLFALFLSVLLIACANLANLHLARASSRAAEIAMRLSLGASRSRIIRQLLTESLVLALAGSALGLACASLGLSTLEQYLWSSMTSLGLTLMPSGIDGRVFLFASAIGAIAALAFGLLPALEATAAATRQGNLQSLTKARPRRLRGVMIAAQVACSLVLLLVAGILARNIQRASDAGFPLDRVYALGSDRPTAAALRRLRQEPWIASASATSRIPFMSRLAQVQATIDGQAMQAGYNYVDESFFETLGVRLVAGRLYTRQEAAQRAKVAVISQATARKFWPGASPEAALGRSVALHRVEDAAGPGTYQVIGIVPDLVTGWIFSGKDTTAIYLPAAAGDAALDSVLLRIHVKAEQAKAGLLALCLESNLGCEPSSLRDVEGLQRFTLQAAAAIASALGGLALLLTAVGLHGVVRYLVVQREREIGVRMALGAAPARIVRWIVSESSGCVAAGLALGLVISLVLAKLASSSVLELRTFDLVAFTAIPLALAFTALAACASPAWRASRVDPIQSLRQE